MSLAADPELCVRWGQAIIQIYHWPFTSPSTRGRRGGRGSLEVLSIVGFHEVYVLHIDSLCDQSKIIIFIPVPLKMLGQ